MTRFPTWLAVAYLATIALPAAAVKPAKAPPKLTVLVVVDQFPAEALIRHRKYLRGAGLAELLEEGAVFPQAYFRHATTMTGPGHALLGSGQYGHTTGIVGNDWYDRVSTAPMYCVADPTVTPSTPTAARMGPHNFQGRSLASRIKSAYPDSRVVSVSLKDRAAILMVGEGADSVYWLDKKAGGFVSVDAYKYDPRPFAFNAGLDAFLRAHPVWTYSIAKPTATVCPADRNEYHEKGHGQGFPHPVANLEDVLYTPFGNDLLEQFAERVVSDLRLGRNPFGAPDFLAVSFSAYDYMGHAYGPDSCELADATARLDETLGRLIKALKEASGGDVRLILTADHGSAPIPELLRDAGKDAGRVDVYDPASERKRVDLEHRALKDLPARRRAIERAAAADLGYQLSESTGPWLVASFAEPCFYLNPAGPAAGQEQKARYWLKGFLSVQEGVQSVHTLEDFEQKHTPDSLALAFRKDRSGDVCVILKEHWMWSDYPTGTNHGQPYDYDMHVPLIVWGGGVAAKEHAERVSEGQVAPTLASFLGLSLDGYEEPEPLVK